MFGPPGVGKGTITEMIKEEMDIAHISTGDLLREAVKNKTELGLQAKSYMDSGDLVPDSIVLSLLKERITRCNGYILDGFPRDIEQAEALEKEGIKIDKVIDLKAPDETVIDRIASRRICSNCKAVYNLLFMKPKEENKCDLCQGELIQREDDKPESVKHRLEVYHKKTQPLIDFYRNKGLLIEIDASPNDPKIVYSNVIKAFRASVA